MKQTVPIIAFSSVLALVACQPAPGETEIAGEIQGTTFHLKMVLDGHSVNAEQMRQKIENTFAVIDEKLSNYRDDSEISRINRNRTTDWLAVSPEIVELVHIAKQVWQRSDGCYDLTVKPLFDLWGFSKHENRVPTDAEIDHVLKHVGMSRVDTDLENNRLRKRDPDLQIDLSSIAQGYTVAAIASLLENQGIQNYLVEIGGELRVKGTKANGSSWRVAIEKPTPFEREVQRVLELHQQNGTAVMTAGTYRNFFEENGKVYSHILNPETGRPVTHHLLSVTILHEDPTWADAWDTALLCVGESEAMKIAEQEHLKALLIYQDGKELKEFMSSEFLHAQEANKPGAGNSKDSSPREPQRNQPARAARHETEGELRRTGLFLQPVWTAACQRVNDPSLKPSQTEFKERALRPAPKKVAKTANQAGWCQYG